MSILSNISKNTNTGQSLPSSLVTITPVCPLTYMRRGGLCCACPPWGTACCCTPDRIWSPQSPGPLTSSHPAAINMPPPHQDQPRLACVCFCPAAGWLLVTWPASVKMAMIRTQTACYRIKKAAAAASFPSQSQTPDATSFKPQFLSAEFIAIYYFSWHEYWLAPPASLTLALISKGPSHAKLGRPYFLFQIL